MYVLYLDIFFLHNILLIGISSLFLFQLLGLSIIQNYKKLLGGAVAGAGLEVLLLLLGKSYRLFALGSQIVIMPIVLQLLLRGHKEISRWRGIVLSYTVVSLLVGVTNLIGYVFGDNFVLQVGLLGIGGIVEVILLELKKMKQEQQHLYNVELEFQGKKVQGIALYDSGNRLYDPWKHREIHIVSHSLLQQLQLDKIALMVPFQSLGNTEGILEVYEIDTLIVMLNQKKYRFTNVLVGKAQEVLLSNKQYQMILNASILEFLN